LLFGSGGYENAVKNIDRFLNADYVWNMTGKDLTDSAHSVDVRKLGSKIPD